MHARVPAGLCLVALGVALATTGCATRIRNIPNHPLAKQSNAIAERDQRECEQAITGTLKGVWFPAEVEFAACMIARNYQVYMQVIDASVEVKRASLRTKTQPAAVLKDLVVCERTVSKNMTIGEKLGRAAVSVAGVFFWPASVGGMAASATLAINRERDYADCMKPLGYVVTPWTPSAGESGFAPNRTLKGEERVSP
jgi:hypothetical protein